jgi:hypothetical protein
MQKTPSHRYFFHYLLVTPYTLTVTNMVGLIRNTYQHFRKGEDLEVRRINISSSFSSFGHEVRLVNDVFWPYIRLAFQIEVLRIVTPSEIHAASIFRVK